MGTFFPFWKKKEKKGFKTHSIVLTASWVNNQSKGAKKFLQTHIAWNKNHCNIFLPVKVIHPCLSRIPKLFYRCLTFFSFAFVSYLSTWLMGPPHPPPSIYPRDESLLLPCALCYMHFSFLEFVSFYLTMIWRKGCYGLYNQKGSFIVVG